MFKFFVKVILFNLYDSCKSYFLLTVQKKRQHSINLRKIKLYLKR